MDCDLVVLGAGSAGLVAAVKAADLTGKKVIVLEKAKKTGGASIFAHAIMVQDSKWQKDAGAEVNDPQDISGQFFDWLVSKGDMEKYFIVATNGERMFGSYRFGTVLMPQRTPKYRKLDDPSIGPGWAGTVVVDKMVECCGKMGIPVLTETRATKFITDGAGKVVGVLADTNEGQLQVNCKACFIAAGGFGADMEKLKKRWPEVYNGKEIYSLCPPSLTGDGIDMAQEIGAAIDESKHDTGDGFVNGGLTHHPYSYCIYRIMGECRDLVNINLNAERFTGELADQPKAVAYAVGDHDMIETTGEDLIANPPEDADVPILEKFREHIDYEVKLDETGHKGNHAKRADTLYELALKMDVDPEVFVATIEAYNKECEENKKKNAGNEQSTEAQGGPGGRGGMMGMMGGMRSLPTKPIVKPPFYAFFGHRHTQCTKGRNGIAVNKKFQVLDTDGEVMPGLWAGGDACTIYGAATRRMPAGMGGGMPGGAPGGGMPGGAPAGADAGAMGGPPGASGAAPGGDAISAMGGFPGAPDAAAGGGAPGGAGMGATETSDADATGKDLLATTPRPNGGLGSAILSGYQAGIGIADYFKGV